MHNISHVSATLVYILTKTRQDILKYLYYNNGVPSRWYSRSLSTFIARAL